MAKTSQISLFSLSSRTRVFDPRREHGGEIRTGKRKLARPMDPKRPLHLVLRSSRAQGQWSLLRPANQRAIKTLVHGLARKNDVRIYQYANSGNHLHFLVKARTREGFRAFLRTASGLIARLVTGAKKGNATGKFWDDLAFSTLVEWGRHFFRVKYYVIQNELEAERLIPYKERRSRS